MANASMGTDAVQILSADHEEVLQLFDEYEELVEAQADDEEKQEQADRICTLLSIHASVEEEILYPAARESLEEQSLLDEAEVEHASARDLIEQIQEMDPSEDLYDAKVKVLGEYIKHHIREEEGEIFPRLQDADLDLEQLGEEITERRQELMEQMGVEEDR